MAKSRDFYDAAQEIMKNYDLTPNEMNAIKEAKSKITNHMYFASAFGGTVGFLLGKHRRFRPLATIAVGVGGAIIGGQLGLVTGSLSAIRTIHKLPSSEKIFAMMKDMQMEMVKRRTMLPQGPTQPVSGRPSHPFNKSYEQSRNKNDDFSETVTFSDDIKPRQDHADPYLYKSSSSDEVMNDGKVRSTDTMRDDGVANTNNQPDWSIKNERTNSTSQDSSPPWSIPENQSEQANSKSQTLATKTTSAWDKIREQTSQQRREMTSSSPPSASTPIWRQRSDGDEFKEAGVDDSNYDYNNTFYPPRTREDTEQVQREGKIRTNKYGDIT
ncbi:13254_t:CDS:1 [Ambispora leptoticha]|uniref:13254_t:CDS:1 n=1 Tax=Ambispora leptoticha TaxID=144679 RepID=A0A9N9ER50_9GLOM|nr:13254_t:CDS:1 [Ambispora leptoticha]